MKPPAHWLFSFAGPGLPVTPCGLRLPVERTYAPRRVTCKRCKAYLARIRYQLPSRGTLRRALLSKVKP